jgi:hypothetical protein
MAPTTQQPSQKDNTNHKSPDSSRRRSQLPNAIDKQAILVGPLMLRTLRENRGRDSKSRRAESKTCDWTRPAQARAKTVMRSASFKSSRSSGIRADGSKSRRMLITLSAHPRCETRPKAKATWLRYGVNALPIFHHWMGVGGQFPVQPRSVLHPVFIPLAPRSGAEGGRTGMKRNEKKKPIV